MFNRVTTAAFTLALLALTACGSGGDGDDEVAGTWSHAEEGTIVLSDGGDGTVTQSSDPVAFT